MKPMKAHERKPGTDVTLLWALVGLGALPFLGFLVVGTWSQTELGLGAALVAFALQGLVREYRRRRQS